MLLNDKVQFRMHWPQYAELQVNGIVVPVVPRPSSQLLGSNGRDDGPVITTLCHEGQNKIFLSSADTRPFCFGIRIARRRTVDQVLNLVPKEADGESFEDSLARVRRCLRGGNTTDDADSDSDLEVVADFFPVSLRCPNSGSRIRTAGRFKPCVHMGCFDLQTFVELNQRSRKWQCPTCLKNYSVENIIIDQYFNRITSLLRNCNEDVNEIDVKPDGSWCVKGDVENRELAQWHMPDGSLCNLKRDTKLVAGHVKQFKKEGDYDGSKSLKIGSKSNLNGIWEVSSKADDKKPPVTVNHIENIEYHVANIVPVSSSYTGSYRDGKDLSVNQECGMHFDLSLNTGHELDSFSHKFGQMYRIEDRSQQQLKDADVDRSQQQLKDADVIVLSDSDEENVAIVFPPAAYDNNTANIGGFAFDASTTAEFTENYQEDGGVGGSGLGLFANNSDIFDINPWPMQSRTQPEQGYQFFGTDTDATNTLVDSHNSFDMAPNGYTLDNAGAKGTSVVQDISTCHARTEGLVDNLLAFSNDDSSLQIFLPSQPSGIPTKEERNEHDNISNGVQPDDWISLTLAAGGGGNEESEPADALNPQPQIPSKETRMEPLSDAAASLLSLNDDRHNEENSNPRAGNIFSHPRHPRSVRPRLRLSIDSDSE